MRQTGWRRYSHPIFRFEENMKRNSSMLTRRAGFFAALAVFGLMTAPAARAEAVTPFTPALFDAAKAAGKPILLEVTAPWCPTCKAQKPILAELTADPKFKDLVVLEIDFDSQKEPLRALKVQSQSTLVVFKGAAETGRSTGDTKRESIAALLNGAL
jgi:thioredoxin 1